MAFVTAIKADIRDEILRILREDIVYLCSPNDVNKPIVPASIVQQKTRAQINVRDLQSNQLTDVPGLLLCSPLRTPIPPTEGTNERDWWHYLFLVQLVDADLWGSTDRQASWDRWIEQIMSAFMFTCLGATVVLPKGQVITTVATGVQDIDERRWARDGKFISGVEIEVRVAQPRGIAV